MITDLILLFTVTAALLAVIYFHSQRKPKNFPPGPLGFPLLGHLPLLGPEPHKTAAALVPKYGTIVGLDFASYRAVIISDYRLAKEAFAHPAFAGRPHFSMACERSGGDPDGEPSGIVFTQGRAWREQRGFAQRRLRELTGGGRCRGGRATAMEAAIAQQVDELIAGLRADAPAPVSTHARFNVAVVNALWALLAGRPFAQCDPEAQRVTRVFVDAMAEHSIFLMLSMFMPWFANALPGWLTGRDGLERMYKPMLAFLRPHIEAHWRERPPRQQPETAPRDFIDAYIDEIRATTDPASSFYAGGGEEGENGGDGGKAANSLATTLMDLFAAGTETTATTLSWVCLLLASYPTVQEKVADEIGVDAPSLSDRPRLPYTEAVLHEVMRFRPVGPLAMFHATTAPVNFHGFDLPCGTMVFINVYEAHHNVALWGDPEVFRPERWLDVDGAFVRGREGFLAFSTGRRVCLGEQLARDQLFLFTTGLVRAFRIEVDPNAKAAPSLEPKLGGTTLGPKPHRLVFTPRSSSEENRC